MEGDLRYRKTGTWVKCGPPLSRPSTPWTCHGTKAGFAWTDCRYVTEEWKSLPICPNPVVAIIEGNINNSWGRNLSIKNWREETGIMLDTRVWPNLPGVTGDRAMLRMVLFYSNSNALKSTRPVQQAEIENGCPPDTKTETIIFVRNNGVGFDMNFADKLFTTINLTRSK